jgi:hypothetical protein
MNAEIIDEFRRVFGTFMPANVFGRPVAAVSVAPFLRARLACFATMFLRGLSAI